MNDEIFSKGSVSLSSFFYDNFKHCDDPKNRAIIDVKEEKKKDSCAAPPSINVVVLRNQSNVVKESGSALKCNFAFERASVPHTTMGIIGMGKKSGKTGLNCFLCLYFSQVQQQRKCDH